MKNAYSVDFGKNTIVSGSKGKNVVTTPEELANLSAFCQLNRICENATGKSFCDGTAKLKVAQHIFNTLEGSTQASKAEKEDKTAATEPTLEELAAKRKTTAKKSAKESGPKEPSKRELMVQHLMQAKNMHRKIEDLMAASGFDRRNCFTMISILANPKRTKNPIIIARNDDGDYTIQK